MCTSPGIDIGLGACLNQFLIFLMFFASSSRSPAFCKAPGSPSTPDTTGTTDSRKKSSIILRYGYQLNAAKAIVRACYWDRSARR
jgi:hypothetical protein